MGGRGSGRTETDPAILKARGGHKRIMVKPPPPPEPSLPIVELPKPRELEQICRTGIPGFDPWRFTGGATFDPQAAQNAIRFFHTHIRHQVGPLAHKLFVLRDHQIAFVGNLFGWKKADGTRRFRVFYYSEGRFNGKSTLAAAMQCKMIADPNEFEPGAEIVSMATDVDQAFTKVWRPAKAMIEEDYWLAKRCKCWAKSINRIDDALAYYRALPDDPEGAHAIHPTCVIIDELHTQTSSETLEILETGIIGRPNGMLGAFTTAGWDRESPCYTMYLKAKAVMAGEDDDPTFLPSIHECGERDDWTDEANWYKANPNLGVTIDLDTFRDAFRKAQKSPVKENKFRNLHLNQWTQQAVRWLKMEDWDASDERFEVDALRGQPCWGGLDLGWGNDLTAFVLLFRAERSYKLLCHFWMGEHKIVELEKEHGRPYRQWAKAGMMTITPGESGTDYSYVERYILDVAQKYKLRRVGFDKWKAGELTAKLHDEHRQPLVEVTQGAKGMSEPAKQFATLVEERKMLHNGNPILRWMAENVSVRTKPDGSIIMQKPNSKLKIDGIVAAVLALKVASVDVAPEFVYNVRGLRQIG